ncbi:hypothetical protein [Salsuginibacillus kocurii]|nr:hypothetical protein [Salsuginibacillus kocurii]
MNMFGLLSALVATSILKIRMGKPISQNVSCSLANISPLNLVEIPAN